MPVYFIRAGATPYVKIGSAVDVQKRLYGIQQCNHEPLTVIRTTEGGRQCERWFHRYFRHLRRANEWFTFAPEMMAVAPGGFVGALALWMGESRVTQGDLMQEFGRDNRTVCAWLRGETLPNLEFRAAIAERSQGRIPVDAWCAA